MITLFWQVSIDHNMVACNAGVFWRAIEHILTRRAPSWIQTRKRLGRDEKVSLGVGVRLKDIEADLLDRKLIPL